ncbi:hypothetical protein PENTCL1PPCAC_27015, partial [Pristionchus entomophagus]
AISFHGSCDAIGTLSNLLLLIAIILRSPPNLRSYSVILLNSVSIDLIACFCSLVVMIRVIPADSVLAYIYLGPCTLTSVFICHFAYTVMLHTFAHSLYLIIVSFSYRFYVLKRPSPSRFRLFLICIVVYLPSLCLMIIFLFALDPQNELLEAVLLVKPDFEFNQGYMYAGHASIFKPRIAFTIVFMILPALPAIIVIFILRYRVLRILRQNADSMSKKTHDQHANLVKVLSFQSLLPIFFFGGGVSYVICQTGLICSVAQEHLTMAIWGIMPAAAPLITLYYVRPYKSFVLSLARSPMSVVTPRGTASTVISNPHS